MATVPIITDEGGLNTTIAVESGTERTMYSTWTFPYASSEKSHLDHYRVIWVYSAGDGVALPGTDSNTTKTVSTYTAPSNAKAVAVRVACVAKKDKKGNPYFATKWSSKLSYNFKKSAPAVPEVPTVTVTGQKLKAEVDSYDTLAKYIEFQVAKNDKSTYKTAKVAVKTHHASYTFDIPLGNTYKVRCRAIGTYDESAWSEYSGSNATIPAVSAGITTVKAISMTSVRIIWEAVPTATSYEVEYTTEYMYFSSSSQVQSLTVQGNIHHAEITGLDSGKTWYFRVRAVNSAGEGAWCPGKSPYPSTVIGKKPAAPSTWAQSTNITTGTPARFYWVHNAEDNSIQTGAELQVIIDGIPYSYFPKITLDADGQNETNCYEFPTDIYKEGVVLQWRVRTKGILPDYGEWSITRIVYINAIPTLSVEISKLNNWYWDTFDMVDGIVYDSYGEAGEPLYTLTSYPFYISCRAEPSSQRALSYHLSIIAKESYETMDNMGRDIIVIEGQEVFSKIVDTNTSLNPNYLFQIITAGDISLENGITYEVRCTVGMDVGLTAEASTTFQVSWTVNGYFPRAIIVPHNENYTCAIMPYCVDSDDNMIPNVTLSVYRREYDGSFTEIIKNIENTYGNYIADPHPALDLARYRIVARSMVNGSMGYNDIFGEALNYAGVVIQWDEEWSYYQSETEATYESQAWSGSLLCLPYNIDISTGNDPDVELIEYIGRRHPVSYYGTQMGETATWNVEIPKSDVVTLHAIRRLAIYMGDVYVREPSGIGYWAHVTVSYNIKHCVLTIPVTFTITRVEGGM